MALEYHGKNNGGPNQWIIRFKITPRLLKIHFSLLIKSSRQQFEWLRVTDPHPFRTIRSALWLVLRTEPDSVLEV